MTPSDAAVAVIGAGPGGLAAARWLRSEGFSPTIFDRHDQLGGQWAQDNPSSGIWPDMVTNTFLEATRFSDLPYPEGTPIFPHNRTVLAYLHRYADRFGLTRSMQLGWSLVGLESAEGGYQLRFEREGRSAERLFPRVVVATGRFNRPAIPEIAGAESFQGSLGLIHSFDYDGPVCYRDRAVVVAGGSISGLEIASELAMAGARSVHLTQRRQRYVNPKMVRGVPIEYHLFTHRRGRLALDDDPSLAADDERLTRTLAGDPTCYGAPAPHPDFAKAGVTGSQHYLPLVAEGRVQPVPWIAAINGRCVTFVDGATVEADAIIAATGFDLDLPFLSAEIGDVVKLSPTGLALDEFTFHPNLPGLAFVGLWAQAGSYFTPLEQQARYIAYTWSGTAPHRSEDQMRAGVEASIVDRHHGGTRRQAEMALRFARLCGTDPVGHASSADLHSTELDPTELDPTDLDLISSSAVTGDMFRLVGPDRVADGRLRLLGQAERYGPPR